ncbi:transposable element Tcb1 transposase [Trichonephila clavipes]|nr:transposable element Tcb1 transposase [Trichonephila clavipes]
MMEAGWSARRVARQLSKTGWVPTASSAATHVQVAPSLGVLVSSRTIPRHPAEGHLGSRHPLRVLPLMPTHPSLRLDSDDNRVRVRRPRGERLNPAFSLLQHTAPTDGVMVWSDIAYNTRSPIVLIRSTP